MNKGEVKEAKVGDIDWRGCDTCIYMRPDDGGCNHLDDNTAIIVVDIDGERVVCKSYREAWRV